MAFKMPSNDENHQFHLMETERLVFLLTGAYSLYECPSEIPRGSSAESPLMVQINGCKLSNSAISVCPPPLYGLNCVLPQPSYD